MIIFLMLIISMVILTVFTIAGLVIFLITEVPETSLIQAEGKRTRQKIDQITHEFLFQIYSQPYYQEEEQ